MDQVKKCIPQILFGPFLNTLSQIIVSNSRFEVHMQARHVIVQIDNRICSCRIILCNPGKIEATF